MRSLVIVYQLSGCLYFVRYWTICVFIVIIIFLIKLFLLHDLKVKTNILRTKGAFKMK